MQVVLAEHQLVLGEAVLTETRRVLAKKLGLPGDVVERLTTFLRRHATVVTGSGELPIQGVDAADAAVLAEAVAGTVDWFVTGDHRLLATRDLPVRLVSPRDLWEQFRRAT